MFCNRYGNRVLGAWTLEKEVGRRSQFCSTMKQLTAPMGLLMACNIGLLWRLHSIGWPVRRKFDAFGMFSHILIRPVAHINQLLHFYFLLIESHKGTVFFFFHIDWGSSWTSAYLFSSHRPYPRGYMRARLYVAGQINSSMERSLKSKTCVKE